MMKSIVRIGMTTLVLLAGAGCAAAPVEAEEAEEDGAVVQTTQALSDVVNCATGTTANAVGSLVGLYSTDSYSRASGYIDGICPAIGDDRAVTVVDFAVSTANGREYTFWVQPTWWETTNATQCAALTLDVRFQYQPLGTTSWVTMDFKSLHGEWNQGHCDTPRWVDIDVNQADHYTRKTSRYRIRTEALQWDHNHHATVWVNGRNSGT